MLFSAYVQEKTTTIKAYITCCLPSKTFWGVYGPTGDGIMFASILRNRCMDQVIEDVWRNLYIQKLLYTSPRLPPGFHPYLSRDLQV